MPDAAAAIQEAEPEGAASAPAQRSSHHSYVCLAGWASYERFLNEVKSLAAEPERLDEQALQAHWQSATQHVRALEISDSIGVDPQALAPLPGEMERAIAARIQKFGLEDGVQGTNGRWAMVKIDRLGVFQHTIDLSYVDALESQWPDELTTDDIAAIVTGTDNTQPTVKHSTIDEGDLFTSLSNDVRCLEIRALPPDALPSLQLNGRAVMVLTAIIGFTVNILSAMCFRNRVLLTNGSHRTYALRTRGVTQIPYWVRFPSNEDEFQQHGWGIRNNHKLCFEAPRPPMFKDYFDPRLYQSVAVRPSYHVLQIQHVYRKTRKPID